MNVFEMRKFKEGFEYAIKQVLEIIDLQEDDLITNKELLKSKINNLWTEK